MVTAGQLHSRLPCPRYPILVQSIFPGYRSWIGKYCMLVVTFELVHQYIQVMDALLLHSHHCRSSSREIGSATLGFTHELRSRTQLYIYI